MFFCLRVDLDYVPWDEPDAAEFGHGEPAVTLRLLELARDTGYKLHFFASTRVLHAFPSAIAAILDESHDLDWLCKYPETPHSRYLEARACLAPFQHTLQGMAVRGEWPEGASAPDSNLRFISASRGETPANITLFPTLNLNDREAIRNGVSIRRWVEDAKAALRQSASRNLGSTICVRPQVLARFDPRLTCVKEVTDFAEAIGLQVISLRDAMKSNSGQA